MSGDNGVNGNLYTQYDDEQGVDSGTQEQPLDQTTQEFAAQLPEDVADDLAIDDPSISPPIYPPAIDVGVAPEYPAPVHYGRDWRLLLPPDSDTYKDAVDNPLSDDDPQYQQVLRMIVDSVPDRD